MSIVKKQAELISCTIDLEPSSSSSGLDDETSTMTSLGAQRVASRRLRSHLGCNSAMLVASFWLLICLCGQTTPSWSLRRHQAESFGRDNTFSQPAQYQHEHQLAHINQFEHINSTMPRPSTLSSPSSATWSPTAAAAKSGDMTPRAAATSKRHVRILGELTNSLGLLMTRGQHPTGELNPQSSASISASGSPAELSFTNASGAAVACSVAVELARAIEASERALRAQPSRSAGTPDTPTWQNDVQIRWERANGEPVEPVLVVGASLDTSGALISAQNNNNNNSSVLLRHVRPSDGALVFEPFEGRLLQPEVHLATYRCLAHSPSQSSTMVGRDVRVRAHVVTSGGALSGGPNQSQLAPEVLDELVVEGNSAVFKCQLPFEAQAAEQSSYDVIEWLEQPTELSHTFASTTLANAQLLFGGGAGNGRPSAQSSANKQLLLRYFMMPKTGDLHILNVDSSFNYRSFRCRAKHKLTGEVITSINKGKLIVTDAHAAVAPRMLLGDDQPLRVFDEGDLGLLACGQQAWPPAHVTWSFRPLGAQTGGPLPASGEAGQQSAAQVAQLANLLLIGRLSRNHSGTYTCEARNQAGDERLETELFVRARLRAKLSASGQVLELGKSLALECTISGAPIELITFRHNGQVIKTIQGHSGSSRLSAEQQHLQQSASDSYFVLDEGVRSALPHPSGSKQGPLNAEQPSSVSHMMVVVLEPQHSGAYQCFAHNKFESVESGLHIRVLDDPPTFRDAFRAQVVEQQSDVSLLCSARANPLPEITWSVDGQPIPESSRIRFGDFVTKDNLVISYVNISQSQVIDGGLYRCVADNGLASVAHEAPLHVLGPLQVKVAPNLTVLASGRLVARCPVAGYPIKEVQWHHNGRRLPANHRQRVFENGSLEVEHMERSQDDHGAYVCVATSGAQGSQSVHATLHVQIRAKPVIEPFAISKSLREGQRASIMCTISSGDLPIDISWLRNNQPIQNQQASDANEATQSEVGGPQQVAPGAVRVSRVSDYSSTLLFESLVVEHSANYTCVARNEAGSSSYQANMLVQVAPKWNLEPVDSGLVRGSSLSIDCMASGFPPPRIIWTKAVQSQAESLKASELQPQALVSPKSQPLGTWRSIVSSPHLQVFENGSLNILDARDSDQGHYMCQASNGVGAGLSKVIKVTIHVGAHFGGRHSVQFATRGDQTQLKCQAKGDWPTSIVWFRSRSRLEPVNQQTLTTTSGGSKSGAEQQHSLSSWLSSVALVPSAMPSSSAIASLSGRHASSLPAGDLAHKLGQLLQSLALDATLSNSNSMDEPNPQQAAHQGLDIKQGDKLGGGQLAPRLSLATSELALEQRTSLAGADLAAQHDPSDESASRQGLLVQVTSSLTISHADRSDTGTYKCIAANPFGIDERTIQLIVQDSPEKIDDLSVVELGSRSVALTWQAPNDGNAPIASYLVQYRPSGSHEMVASWFNHSLSVQLGPSNSNSNSSMSMSLSDMQMQMQQLRGSTSSSSSVMIPSQTGRITLKVSIGGLKPMTTYAFRVAAENKLGSGPMSPPVECTTQDEAPAAAPPKVKASGVSASSILVSWSRISERELFGPIHGYYVAYKPLMDSSGALSEVAATNHNLSSQLALDPSAMQSNSGNIYKTIKHDDKASRFEAQLTGLLRNTMYVVSVQAFNLRGTGPSSEPLVARTLELDPPRAPRLSLKSATNCSLELEWVPASKDELIDFYTLHQSTGSAEGASSGSRRWLETRLPKTTTSTAIGTSAMSPDHHVIDQLRCGLVYQFYLVGHNRVGRGEQSEVLEAKTLGGLPVAPAKPQAFDVVNATCYVIRLDRWHDNGCPMRTFSVRYREDSPRTTLSSVNMNAGSPVVAPTSSDWHQLAQVVLSQPGDVAPEVNLTSTSNNLHRLLKRSSTAPDEVSKDESPEQFMDEGPDDSASAYSGADYLSEYDTPVAALDVGALAANSSAEPSQLYSLLKDSMLPAFEMSSMQRERRQRAPLEWPSTTRSMALLTEGASPATPTSSSSRQHHADVQSSATSGQDWRRIRLCELNPNALYTVQITGSNSVGDTEAEYRLQTSYEWLEFDPETKRHVVPADRSQQQTNSLSNPNSRMAQSSSSSSADSMMQNWPNILVPGALFATLTVSLVFISILLRRASSSGSSGSQLRCSPTTTATSTTTATMATSGSKPSGATATTTSLIAGATNTSSTSSSGASSHCQSIYNGPAYHQHHAGQPYVAAQYSSDAHHHHFGHQLDSYKPSNGNSSGIGSLSDTGATLAMSHMDAQAGVELTNNNKASVNNSNNTYAMANLIKEDPAYGIVDFRRASDSPSQCQLNQANGNPSSCILISSSNNRHEPQANRNVYLWSNQLANNDDGQLFMNGNHEPQMINPYSGANEPDQVIDYQSSSSFHNNPNPNSNNDNQESQNLSDMISSNHQLMSLVEQVARNNQSAETLLNSGSDKVALVDPNQATCINRAMGFDPIYSTIRRNFPQAFKYLTLQQQHHHHHHNTHQLTHQNLTNNQQGLQAHDAGIQCVSSYATNGHRTRHLINSTEMGLAPEPNKSYDLSMFNSSNLAALNLLTPTTSNQQHSQQILNHEQHHQP